MPSPKKNLGIPEKNKVIISLDGGGMRGILTLQLLKKLEEVAGAPCHQWCDLVAGTSTGGIIAGLILKRKSAKEIEDLYMQLVSQVFTKRNFLSDRFLNPPKFDKENYRNLLNQVIGDVTLAQACADQRAMDLLITSKDMAAGEETFFTCFRKGATFIGTYKDVLLRAVMEATMSAPTYFVPFERFIDGGTTTFNNPAGAAVLEALCYSGKETYKANALTVFSFGTGTSLRFIKPEDTRDPKGLDLKFWLNYVMDETSKDASDMQMDMLRSSLMPGLDFRRYQISLDETSLNKIPDKDISTIYHTQANRLRQLSNHELGSIDMADVSKFSLMQVIGQAMAEYICPIDKNGKPTAGNWFKEDLVFPGSTRDQLVTAFGATKEIAKNLSSKAWLNKQPTD
jgi:uncharacterized protein